MNEDELKKMFEDAAAHTPDPQAKKRALNAAMAEFASLHEREKTEEVKNKKQSQGFFRRFRLTSSSDKQNRRQDMKISNFLRNRWLLTGVATACVAFFGVMLTQHHSELKQSIPTEPHKQQDIAANPQHFVVPPPAGDKEKERKVGDNKNLPLPLPAGGPGRKLAAIPQNAKLESNEALSVYKELQKQAEAAQTKLKRGKLDLDYTGPHPSVISVGIPIVGALSKPSKPGMPQPPYPDIVPPQGYVEEGRDRFESFETNPIKRTVEEPVSTFSIDFGHTWDLHFRGLPGP